MSRISWLAVLGIACGLSPAGAQGPSIAARTLWGSGDDLPRMTGVSLTLRPPANGVSISAGWLVGRGVTPARCNFLPNCGAVPEPHGLRMVDAMVGYSAKLAGPTGGNVFLRPAVGFIVMNRKVDGSTTGGRNWVFPAISGDLEVSRQLFGLPSTRWLIGVNGIAAVGSLNACADCTPFSFEKNFFGIGVTVGLMLTVR